MPAVASRDRKLERIRRAQARHVPAIVATPSGQDRTDAVVAWCLRLLDRDAQSGGGSAP